MPLDPSIILQAQPHPLDALGMYGQVAGIQNALNQNRLFQANAKVGQLAQKAIGPDGQFDQNKFNALLAGQDVGPGAIEGLKGGNEVAAGQQQVTQQHLATAQKELELVGPAITSLLAKKGPLTYDDVSKAAASLVGHPEYPSDWKSQLIQSSVGYLADLKGQLDKSPSDPASQDQVIRNSLTQFGTRMENTRAQIALMAGTPMATDVGPGVVQQTYSPVNGFKAESYLPKGLSPEQLTQPIKIIDPSTGAETTTTTGDWLNKVYGGKPPFAGPGLGNAPQTNPQPSGLAPAVQQAQVQSAAENVKQSQTFQEYANGVPDHKAILANMRAELPNFDTGPAAKASSFLGQMAAQFGVADKGWQEAQSARESFSKLAYQIANQQRNALGGHGTDAQTEAAMHATPSEFLTRLGNEKVIALLTGNEDAIAGKNAAWQKYQQKYGPGSWGQFNVAFNRYYDPRAFQWPYMTAGQQAQVKKDLQAHGEWDGFNQKLQFARQVTAQAGN